MPRLAPIAAGDITFEYERPWLYDKQREAIFAPRDKFGDPARFSWIEASTKTGKTVGCIVWLFEQAFTATPGTNHWWVAPVFGQAKIGYTRMKRAYPHEVFRGMWDGDLRLELQNEQMISFKSGEHPDNLYGEDVFSFVADEASRMRAEASHALRSTVTATRAPGRYIGNVKGRKNWFYEGCRRAEQGLTGHGYYRIIAHDAAEAGVLDEDEIAGAKRELPDAVFRELYLAEPSDDQGNPFGLSAIRQCRIPALSNNKPAVWGWDLAKGGKLNPSTGEGTGDWVVGIALDNAGYMCRFERWQGPWLTTRDRIKALTGSTRAYVDSTGAGDVVFEALIKDNPGNNYEPYVFTSASKQKLMEGLAVALQSGNIGICGNELISELEIFEYQYTRTGTRYSAPDGFHDDCVCALALANAGKVLLPPKLAVPTSALEKWQNAGNIIVRPRLDRFR